jgi:hypothetical protein
MGRCQVGLNDNLGLLGLYAPGQWFGGILRAWYNAAAWPVWL